MYQFPSAEADVVDANLGEALPMAALTRVVLSALVLENDDLLTAAVLHDLSGDLGAFECRNAGLDVLVVGAEEDVVELDLGPSFADERWNSICSPRLDAKLLATSANDSVRHGKSLDWCRARKLKGSGR